MTRTNTDLLLQVELAPSSAPSSPRSPSRHHVALDSPYNKVRQLDLAGKVASSACASHTALQEEALAVHTGDYERQLVMSKRPWDM